MMGGFERFTIKVERGFATGSGDERGSEEMRFAKKGDDLDEGLRCKLEGAPRLSLTMLPLTMKSHWCSNGLPTWASLIGG